MLQRLLEKLEMQAGGQDFTFSVVVADNDAEQSARGIVEAFSARSLVEVVYCVEPRKNIALVRNKAVAHARGEYIALIDDDEFPVTRWLSRLLQACTEHNASGVLGPVRPHFAEEPPKWIIRGGFCDRPEYPTGTPLSWPETRTGNALIRRTVFDQLQQPFSPEFSSGGEDQDFFRRAMETGATFVWCNEGVAYETVPSSRWDRRFLVKRALLRGRNSLKHPEGRLRLLAKSVVAVPVYVLALPVAALGGHHQFMKCLVKLCDHGGRLLTVLRLNPVTEREM